MNIKEYWARLVAAGLAPEWENVVAYWDSYGADIHGGGGKSFKVFIQIEEFNKTQLRKDGKEEYDKIFKQENKDDN